jgi:hypothetical protein
MFHEAMELNCAYNVGQMRFVELGSSSWVRRNQVRRNQVRRTGFVKPGRGSFVESSFVSRLLWVEFKDRNEYTTS